MSAGGHTPDPVREGTVRGRDTPEPVRDTPSSGSDARDVHGVTPAVRAGATESDEHTAGTPAHAEDDAGPGTAATSAAGPRQSTDEPPAPIAGTGGYAWVFTDWADPRVESLLAAMSAEVSPRYAAIRADHPAPPGPTAEQVEAVVLALRNDLPAATGTLRRIGTMWEVKRLFVAPEYRRDGLARGVLERLEEEVLARGGREVHLQTGNRQPEAIALYERSGWQRVPVFAPYDPHDGISVCFRKQLRAAEDSVQGAVA